MNTEVSKLVDIRIKLAHPVDCLDVALLKWPVETTAQVSPVVREDSVENALVRVEVFVRVIFCEPLELATQLRGLPQ